MKVAEILKRKGAEVATIGAEQTVMEAAQKLVDRNIGSLVVMDAAGKVAGIITERDILKESSRRLEAMRKTPVREVMTRSLIVGRLDDELKFVEYVMSEKRIRHLPILSGDKLEGMVSIGDVLKAIRQETAEEADDLRQKLAAHYVVG